MSALLIGLMTVRNTNWQEQYQREIPALIKKHGGRLVAASLPERFEGNQMPDRLVILEFPDLESARRWYSDPSHAPLIELRQSGASFDLIGLEVKE
jgi:uncharacterized protein (DUF1330 family)